MANNFSNDSNCVALWRFENGALTTDSKGTNTLTASASSPTSDTTTYKEGSGSVDCERSSNQYFSRTDTNLSAGFPFKNGDATKKVSICCWIRLESNSPSGQSCTIVGKQGAGNASFWFKEAAGSLVFGVYAGGWQDYTFGASLTTGRWYHLGVTYQDSDKAYRIRVWDDTAGALAAADTTGTGTKNVVGTTDSLWVGAAIGSSSHAFDGLLDEVVVFKDILTADEIDAIRGGTYGASSSSSSSSSSVSSSSSSSQSSSSQSSSSFSSSSSSFSSSSLSSSSSWSFSSSSASSAAPLQFPTLSKGVDLSIEEAIADAGQLVSDPSQGRRLIHTHAYRAGHRLRLSVSYITQADRRTLARFYLSTAVGPCLVWEWTHPKSAQTYLLSFDPDSPPVWSREARQPDKHHAEFTVVEHITDGYLTGVYS